MTIWTILRKAGSWLTKKQMMWAGIVIAVVSIAFLL